METFTKSNRNQKKEDEAANNEFRQVISTIKLFEVKPDPQSERNVDFCADQNKGEYGKGILAFSYPIISGNDVVKEAFIGCQTTLSENQAEWLPADPVSLSM